MSKKVAILFHSVCGNNYLLSQALKQSFENRGCDIKYYRLCDPNYEKISEFFEASRQHRGDILSIAEFDDINELLDRDIICLASPTYFGNVSAPVKSFMDLLCDFWPGAELRKKRFCALTCASTHQGGGDMCLNAMNIFAMHMGMIPVPALASFGGAVQPAYGIVHVSGGDSNIRPGADTKEAIDEYAKWALSV